MAFLILRWIHLFSCYGEILHLPYEDAVCESRVLYPLWHYVIHPYLQDIMARCE
jgi:hypothetical protein